MQYISQTFNCNEQTVPAHFQFQDTAGFIELCFFTNKALNEQSGEEGEGTSHCINGWSIRPHQKPTRVSMAIVVLIGYLQ